MKKRILLAIVLGLLGVCCVAKAQMPSYSLKDLSGKTIDSAKLHNDGKPMIVSFWATWCKPCLRELKAINDLYPDWQEETDVKVIAISIDEAQNTHRVAPLVKTNGWTFDVYLDPNSDLRRSIGGNAVPFVIILNGKGEIVYKHTGYVEGGEEELIEVVRKNL